MFKFLTLRRSVAFLIAFGWLGIIWGCAVMGINEPPLSQATPASPLALQATLTPTSKATLPAPTPTPTPKTDGQAALPLRAAFYYPWFPEAWSQQEISPYTNYTPTLGIYNSSDAAAIRRHITAMQYANISAGIASWWGQGSRTDLRLATLLAVTNGSPFHWSIYYEPEGTDNPLADEITDDLTYLRDHYGNDPNYLRINGRLVVFVYGDSTDNCEMVDRWKQANTINAYIVLKVFAGYRTCANQPDGWHQYAPAAAADVQGKYSYTISPGFWKVGENPRLTRDLSRWYADVRNMVASGAAFQLITTFNEWGEGSVVESAQQWQSDSGYGAYLDALHTNGLGEPPIATPQIVLAVPTPPPTPTATPAPLATPTPRRTTVPTPRATPQPLGNRDVVLAGAGDISCDPNDANFNGGVGTAGNCHMKQTSDILMALRQSNQLNAVFVAGDVQYEDGDYAKFMQSFNATWGRLKDIMYPAVGNHEYLTPRAAGYYQYFGAAAGDPKKGYYSYDLGAWHIVVINSMCSMVGGCDLGSPQERWLRADLAAHPTQCTLAYWHHPRYSSGQHGSFIAVQSIWKALYDGGAELVVAGHDHNYERFAPQDASGGLDPTRGIRQFVVGTGAKNRTRIGPPIANSEVRNDATYGILKLTLHPNSYDWQFIPEAGKTFTDSGSNNCH